VRALRAAGAHGVACIRPVMAAADPAAAVNSLCQELNVFPKMDTA
jgi:thiamine monophosphate synthase